VVYEGRQKVCIDVEYKYMYISCWYYIRESACSIAKSLEESFLREKSLYSSFSSTLVSKNTFWFIYEQHWIYSLKLQNITSFLKPWSKTQGVCLENKERKHTFLKEHSTSLKATILCTIAISLFSFYLNFHNLLLFIPTIFIDA